MNSFDQIDKMIDFHVKNGLGNRIILYYNNESIKQIDSFFKGLILNGVYKNFGDDKIKAKHKHLYYRGIDIDIVNVDDLTFEDVDLTDLIIENEKKV